VCSIGTIDAVAEHTVAFLLSGLKSLPQFDDTIRKQAEWPHWEGRNQVRQLAGSHVGLVGFGRIGRTVASIVLSMGAFVSVFVRHAPVELDPTLTRYRDNGRLRFCSSLEDIFRPGSIVSVHVPHTPATECMITEDLLARLGPQGIFINTARGALVDEDGLRRVLTDGRLGFAGLDVLRSEPPKGSSKALLDAPNLIVTPHLAGGGSDVVARRVRFAVDNLVAFHSGAPLQERVVFPTDERTPR
jgi:phosphoglycerate dehydrogenase-like enzyme